jgi:hypothetical protein
MPLQSAMAMLLTLQFVIGLLKGCDYYRIACVLRNYFILFELSILGMKILIEVLWRERE